MSDRVSTTPNPRDSALAFTEGSKSGWITSDLVAWINDHLIVPGRFHMCEGSNLRVFEHGLGELTIDKPLTGSRQIRSRTTSRVPLFVATARDRIIQVLRATARTGETGFVNAALYAGRVARERRPDGRAEWQTRVSEDDALSDQVLALFAADALTLPSDYELGITVCDVCGDVSFRSGPGARNGCVYHPYGSLDGKPSDSVQMKAYSRT
ncbi:MAG: hypothetical protein FWD57_00860 [Polyangiaceae bacterium]|nr:hypothetical protein [Polyangiaceae bacterium]